MSKSEISFENRDRFIQLGISIAALRKFRGMSQEQLAEKAHISRSHLSAIEAPNMIRGLSLNTLFNIADALDISADELLNASVVPDRILARQEKGNASVKTDSGSEQPKQHSAAVIMQALAIIADAVRSSTDILDLLPVPSKELSVPSSKERNSS